MTWLLLYPLPGLLFWVVLASSGVRSGLRLDRAAWIALPLSLVAWPALIPYSFGVIRGTRF